MPVYESRAHKSSTPIKKNQHYYGTVDFKNLYDNRYRMAPKTK